MFPIYEKGKITRGEYANWYAMVTPYEKTDFSYNVIVCDDPEFNYVGSTRHEFFAGDDAAVEAYLADWGVEWISN